MKEKTYVTNLTSVPEVDFLGVVAEQEAETVQQSCGDLIAKSYQCEYEAGVFAHPVVTSQIATSVSIVTNMTSWLPCSPWTWARLLKPRARAVSLINSPDQKCLVAGTLWCSAWLSLITLAKLNCSFMSKRN